MKTLALAMLVLTASPAFAAESVRPTMEPGCILAAVAFAMNIPVNPSIPLPEIRFQSETPLKEFQDDIEPQWGIRPDVITNAYIPAVRRIYLLDEADYYAKYGASIDDSLAHEFVHYIQIRYKGLTMAEFTEWEEAEARRYQIWFRDRYSNGNAPPGAPTCPRKG